MTETVMEHLMAKLCFGEKNGDPDVMCYEDQFLAGLNKFQGLFTDDVDSRASNGATVLTMLPSLHRQSSINIYVGEGSIEKGLLARKSLLNATATISGRTLLRLAKEVLCNCKKMMALVMARDSPYKDGCFPSGTNWDDYAKWCLVAFHKSEISGGVYRADSASTMTSSTICTSNDRQQKDPAVPVDAGQHDVLAENEGAGRASERLNLDGDEQVEFTDGGAVPVGYFFKGFLAWSLWGLIPVVESSTTTMKSTLFGDTKVDTSFGKRMSRLKRAASSVDVDEEGPSTRHQKKASTGKNSSMVVSSEAGDDTANSNEKQLTDLLAKSLALLERQALEKERQKNNFLKERILRDKLSALSRKQNVLSQRYSAMLNRQPVDNMALQAIEKIQDDLESQVGDLEVELTILQDAEVQRRSQAIASHDNDRAVSRSSSSSILVDDHAASTLTMLGARDFMSMSPLTTATHTGGTPTETNRNDEDTNRTNDDEEAQNSNKCIECKSVPTDHRCRKCTQRVCSACCNTKRQLEMVWWCEMCFNKESPESKAIIRAGDYCSD